MTGIRISANGQLTRRAIRCLTVLTAAAGLTVAAAGTASAATHPGAARSGAAQSARAYSGPHFSTPQAAMRYLAAAYNHHNARQLHYVTTPKSYRELLGMRSGAINLRLRSCTLNKGRGDYTCNFIYDYPHHSGHGASQYLVAPARNPGWYMYAVLMCG